MTSDKSFFTTFEEFNGGVVTLRDGSTTHVRGKGSSSLLESPRLSIFILKG